MIVTAAHCIIDKDELERKDQKQLFFIIGKTDLNDSNEQDFKKMKLLEIMVHPSWNTDLKSYEGDIAIAILNKISFNAKVQPICLPSSGDLLNLNVKGSVAGWGDHEMRKSTSVLSYTELHAIDRKICIKADELFSYVMSYGAFCTELSKRGPCAGI